MDLLSLAVFPLLLDFLAPDDFPLLYDPPLLSDLPYDFFLDPLFPSEFPFFDDLEFDFDLTPPWLF